MVLGARPPLTGSQIVFSPPILEINHMIKQDFGIDMDSPGKMEREIICYSGMNTIGSG